MTHLALRIRSNTARGYDLVRAGGVFDASYLTSSTRRGRVQGTFGSISPTITSSAAEQILYVKSIMKKEIIHTAHNGQQYAIQIRKYTPRDCYRLMGVRDPDIDRLLTREKSGQLIIPKSKHYALAGNSIVTNCMTAMFSELFFPSGKHYADKHGQLSLF